MAAKAASKAKPKSGVKPDASAKPRTRAAPQARAGNGDALTRYRAKRNFALTPEPAQGVQPGSATLRYVIQKHAASHLHYDFRLELDGTLKSWAVPKGPSLNPAIKRMAVEVEDHPLSYGDFEGVIPPGQYGAGTVIVWDTGTWAPLGDAREGFRKGHLKFELQGQKLRGMWALVRMNKREGEKQTAWLLIKEKDAEARPAGEKEIVEAMPDSVLQGGKKPAPRATRAAALPPNKEPAKKSKAPAQRLASRGKAAVPALPETASKAALPAMLAPQLATLVDEVPQGDDWRYEIKFDGYRLLTRIDGDKVQTFTRNGNDWSAKLPELVSALRELQLDSAWLDGEIIVTNEAGLPDFQALQNAFETGKAERIEYFVFDLPYYAGHDLRAVPLLERRELLRQLIERAPAGRIHFSADFDAAPQDIVASARQLGLEGVIGKRPSSTYVSRRSNSWIKLKVGLRQEFVIGGYTDPKGSRAGLGALMLGVHDEAGKLTYAGNVGTGFSDATLNELKAKLDKVATDRCPFDKVPANVRMAARNRHWVRPQLLAEVAFGNWTRDGHVRHGVFIGLRGDKPARNIVREQPAPVEKVEDKPMATKTAKSAASKSSKPAATSAPATKAAGRVTHPDRVIDPASGYTKLDLVNYYAGIAPLILPHLKARPVSLVRAPEGIGGELFFQKHEERTRLPGIKVIDAEPGSGHGPLLEIDIAEALFGAAQMNTIELHTRNATVPRLDRADRITFDLDPGEGLSWPKVREAAQLMRGLLKELGLAGMLKTSGGKGLHIVVPIKRDYDWDTVKGCSQAVVQHLAGVIPDRFVAKSGPKNRIGKLFVDYLRNSHDATTVAAWSARARPGIGISVPVAWDELDHLTGGAHWTVANIEERKKIGNTPWQAEAVAPQSLAKAMKLLEFKVSAKSPAAKRGN